MARKIEQGVCVGCGSRVEVDAEPITISGWYGGHYYRWGLRGGVRMPLLVDVRCESCSKRADTDRSLKLSQQEANHRKEPPEA